MSDKRTNKRDRSDLETEEFYCRYYVGHRGNNVGHEFMEFEFNQDGKLRYTNNSNYKRDVMIRKEGILHILILNKYALYDLVIS